MDTTYSAFEGQATRRQIADQRLGPPSQRTANLAEVLERVLDKGIVIAGDITISLADVQLLTIKVRLLIASLDKAQEVGINWWQSDASLSSRAHQLEEENRLLRERLDRLEARLAPDSGGEHDSQPIEDDPAVEHATLIPAWEGTSETAARR
jgi:hypothetical protein